ncbi:MAG: FumA C-terminus/TtdB family hydratase beta subunit [Kiritimatiellia bacterium]|jgi:fumarate hydratase class I
MKSAVVALDHPFTRERVTALCAGDLVSVSGLVYTGRDRLHKHLAETGQSPVDLRDGAIFHCGPVVRQEADGTWRIVAAGPTTSIREEPYMATVIAGQGVRVIIGKGGMGPSTLAACREHGCIYLQAVGGAAAIIAKTVVAVEGVHFLDAFGATEAMWALRINGLQGVVGMDAHGRSLYDDVADSSKRKLAEMMRQ